MAITQESRGCLRRPLFQQIPRTIDLMDKWCAMGNDGEIYSIAFSMLTPWTDQFEHAKAFFDGVLAKNEGLVFVPHRFF